MDAARRGRPGIGAGQGSCPGPPLDSVAACQDMISGGFPSVKCPEFSRPKTPGNSAAFSRPFANTFVRAFAKTFDGSHTEISQNAGVDNQGYGVGVAVGDYDNDGDADLYVTNFVANILYENNGDGTFTNVAARSGTNDPRWSTSAAFLDYDRDGDLDLFVANYVDFSVNMNILCVGGGNTRDYCGPLNYKPAPDHLFRNDGGGRFTDVTAIAGLDAAFGNGLGVVCADFNQDGWIDIYVANDQLANQMWINHGDGTFENQAPLAGNAYNQNGSPEASMGVTAGDFDSDGDEDLFMTHLRGETNTLYVNDGSGFFIDATDRFNLGFVNRPFTGFGSEWFDYDNNGTLDLFVANGAVNDQNRVVEDISYLYEEPNQLFRNELLEVGEIKFRDVSEPLGASRGPIASSRGAAFGDIDNDGDIDIVVANNSGPSRLLLNEIGSERHWISVRLRGERSNPEASGARIAVLRPGKPPLWRRAHRDGSYASANDIRVHFGLDESPIVQGIGVIWPDGAQELWRDPDADSFVTLRQGEGEPWSVGQ